MYYVCDCVYVLCLEYVDNFISWFGSYIHNGTSRLQTTVKYTNWAEWAAISLL